MGQVTTIKGNLFSAPKGSIICHACNTKGVWGAGIAREFAYRFPYAHEEYVLACKTYGSKLLGTCLLIPTTERGGYIIGCLFTSRSFGRAKDTQNRILLATRCAIADLILQNREQRPINMCKINSGLFGVPWNKTKDILKDAGQEFTVYDY